MSETNGASTPSGYYGRLQTQRPLVGSRLRSVNLAVTHDVIPTPYHQADLVAEGVMLQFTFNYGERREPCGG